MTQIFLKMRMSANLLRVNKKEYTKYQQTIMFLWGIKLYKATSKLFVRRILPLKSSKKNSKKHQFLVLTSTLRNI